MVLIVVVRLRKKEKGGREFRRWIVVCWRLSHAPVKNNRNQHRRWPSNAQQLMIRNDDVVFEGKKHDWCVLKIEVKRVEDS